MEIVYKNSLLQKAFFGILLICIVNTFYIGLLHAQAESTENVDIPVVIESTPDGGVWSEAETWIGGQVPTDTNDVVINGSVVLDSDYSIHNLTINEIGVLSPHSVFSRHIEVTGDIINDGRIANKVFAMVHGSIFNNGVYESNGLSLYGTDESRELYGVSQITLSVYTNLTLNQSTFEVNTINFNNDASTIQLADTNGEIILHRVVGAFSTNVPIRLVGDIDRYEDSFNATVVAPLVTLTGTHRFAWNIDYYIDELVIETGAHLDAFFPNTGYRNTPFMLHGSIYNYGSIHERVVPTVLGSFYNEGIFMGTFGIGSGIGTQSFTGVENNKASITGDFELGSNLVVDYLAGNNHRITSEDGVRIQFREFNGGIFAPNADLVSTGSGYITVSNGDTITARALVINGNTSTYVEDFFTDWFVINEGGLLYNNLSIWRPLRIHGNYLNNGEHRGRHHIRVYNNILPGIGTFNTPTLGVAWLYEEGNSYDFSIADNQDTLNDIMSISGDSFVRDSRDPLNPGKTVLQTVQDGDVRFWHSRLPDTEWGSTYSINFPIELPVELKTSTFTLGTVLDVERLSTVTVQITTSDSAYTGYVLVQLISDDYTTTLDDVYIENGTGYINFVADEPVGSYQFVVLDTTGIGYSNLFQITEPEPVSDYFTLQHGSELLYGTTELLLDIIATDVTFSGIVSIDIEGIDNDPQETAIIDGSIQILLSFNAEPGTYTISVEHGHQTGSSTFTILEDTTESSPGSGGGSSDNNDDGEVLGAEDEDTMSVDEDEEKQEEPEYLINIDTQCLKLQSESIIGTWRKDKAWVRPIQTFLKEFGYLHGSIDGDFGTQTKSALIDFQRDSGLVADGIFGIGTAKYIQDHCGEIGVSEDVEEENEEQSDLGDEDNTQSDTVIFKNIKDFFFNSVDSVSNWIKNLFIKNKKINPVLIDTENNEIISVKETIVEEKIVISFAEGTNKSVVSQYSLDVLRDVLIDSDNSYALITSTSRTPEQQAQAMIDNVISKGISSQYRLYGKNGDLVLNLYPDKQAMIDKIYELGPSTVSKHCADFNIKNIIDIAPSSIEKRNKFLSSSKNEVRISKVLSPEEQDGENAYHLEILQN